MKNLLRMVVYLSFLSLFLSLSALAGEFWFYEQQEIPRNMKALNQSDRHWAWFEFKNDPYPDQLQTLQNFKGYDRVSLLFKRSASPALAQDYKALVETWSKRQIETQLKFIASLPTETEIAILKPLCELGAKIYFISAALPMAYEAANLVDLNRSCQTERLELDLWLNRYFRYQDLSDLKRLTGVSLRLVNNYLPAAAHVDTLNLIDNPIQIEVSHAFPDTTQIALLNRIKHLTELVLELDVYPTADQYELLAKLDTTRKTSLRWANPTLRAEDIEAWKKLQIHRIQIKKEVLEDRNIEQKLRTLDAQIIIE